MKISEVAALGGVPTATVRYYERRGLLTPTERTTSGYRQYGTDAARRLRFIKHAQALGFSLEEIQEMLELRPEEPAACARVEATTREKIHAVQQRLTDLRRLERSLRTLADACSEHPADVPCPILAVLSESDAALDGGTVRARGRSRRHA